jgi:hypothetical protein
MNSSAASNAFVTMDGYWILAMRLSWARSSRADFADDDFDHQVPEIYMLPSAM